MGRFKMINKIAMLFCPAFIALVGCQGYRATQIGPNRLSVSTNNYGHESYAKMLEASFSNCKMSGNADYVVIAYYPSDNGSTMIVQCLKEIQQQNSIPAHSKKPEESPPPSSEKQEEQSNISNMVNSAIKDIKEKFK